ncbi:hypothetical protein [Sphingobacterium corticibacter]|nr:hypothetical protein [Sphingobacterium corticibacter]
MKEKDLDKLFRDALESEQATPGPQLWDKIAQQLDEEAESEDRIVPLIPAISKKRNYQWVKYAAACALVGVGLFAYFTTQQEITAPQKEMAHQPPAQKEVEQMNESSSFDVESTPSHITEEKIVAYSTTPVHQQESVREIPSESVKQKHIASVDQPEVNQLATIEQAEALDLPPVRLAEVPAVNLPTRFVTDVEPIKPLIEPFEEEEEMMIAGTVRKATSNVINKIIDVVSDNTPTQVTKDVYVLKDDEGSFRLEIGNLFAKNRTKKRK